MASAPLAILLIFLGITEGLVRIYFSKCGQKGFTCTTNSNKKLDIVYDCRNGTDNVALFINQFQAPANIDNLKIQNCKSLDVSTRCSGENRPIQKLEISNINRLSFQRLQFTAMVPPTVVLQNIAHVDVIPTGTFHQVEKQYHSSGCYAAPVDFQNLYFRNVTVELVQFNAFSGTNQFNNFSWVNVHINRLQTSGIRLRHDLKGSFEIKNCSVKLVDPLGVQVYGRRVTVAASSFGEITTSAFSCTVEDFYFVNNHVELLEPQALIVLATNTFIIDNHFQHLKSGALEKLSPGLIQGLGTNFGKLKFIYDFSSNVLKYIETGSLHPDYVSYENVPTQMMFSRNVLSCDCEKVKWLFTFNETFLESFYEMVLEADYGNFCEGSEGSCQLALRKMERLVKCGKCVKNVNFESLCEKHITTIAQEFNESFPQELTVPEATSGVGEIFCLGVYLTLVIQYFI